MEEGSSRRRRLGYWEIQQEFVKAFNSHFPGNSMEPGEKFDELFSVVPSIVVRHNQLGNSSESESSSGSNTPNKQSLLGKMADQQQAIAPVAVKQMLSYRHHTALKFSEDQPCELKRFFEELGNLFGPANITVDADMKPQAVH